LDHVLLATPVDATRTLLAPIHPAAADLLPTDASSAVLAAFAWTAVLARTFPIPPGFGFLVPPNHGATPDPEPALLACTFVDQKFPHRAPAGARILRAFFGGSNADALSPQSDEAIATAALTQLRTILGPLPDPMHTTVRRWPRSLPQYEVGHLNRMARLDSLIAQLPGLALLGNSYRGVGLPDLIHAARQAARSVAAQA
jgi:oxygen-dependent protoporphyrinogen oxidase